VLRDPLGGVFLGSGAVAAIAGATLIGLALTWDDHTSADSLDEFSNARARARTQLGVGGALAGLGGVLLVGAATRYGVLARRSARLGVAATPKTVGITVGGRF
jgi:hypothetical protein